MNVHTMTQDRTPMPEPLPTSDRRRLPTETSATSGWAARLAQKFPGSTRETKRPEPKN